MKITVYLIYLGNITKICPLILEVLKKAAAKNNRYWSTDQIKRLIPTTRTDNKKPPGFSKFLKSRNMRLTTILLSINW